MRKTLLWLLISLVLAACTAPPTYLSPPPTPRIVRIALVPALKPLERAIYACAEPLPGLAVFVEPVPASQSDRSAYDITISLGQALTDSPFTYQLASDSLIVLVNTANPVQSVTLENLRGLFSGKITRWDEITPDTPYAQPVQLFDYAPENELRGLFFSGIGLDASQAGEALLVPNPEAMLEQVSQVPGALGYAPRDWLRGQVQAEKVKALALPLELEARLGFPILAEARVEPEGAVTVLLDCLQGP